ncbi:MAG: prenyltransferase/squalene oxidase repeat-containing protein [Pirellulales bacterium]
MVVPDPSGEPNPLQEPPAVLNAGRTAQAAPRAGGIASKPKSALSPSPAARPSPQTPKATPLPQAGADGQAAAVKVAARSASTRQPAPASPFPTVRTSDPAAEPKSSATAPVAGEQAAEEAGQDVTEVVIKCAPPWLVSAVIHMAMLIAMGLYVTVHRLNDEVRLDVQMAEKPTQEIWAESLGEQLESPSVMVLNDLPEVDDPFAAPAKVELAAEGPASTVNVEAPHIGLALTGREEGSKRRLLRNFGGTETTEAAVTLGLKWLKQQQRPNGSWNLTGPYPDGANDENIPAATGMALLAFQGAGNTPQAGPFKAEVTRGWRFLLKAQGREGDFFQEGSFNHRFYTHGICTIAVCELYGMTKDSQYLGAAQRAVDYCVKNQDSAGGWRYNPGADSDLSVTGWILMGLQSARMAGLKVPQETLDRIGSFLDKVAVEGGSAYLYQPNSHGGLAMTAEGLLCRQYLGWAQNDPRLKKGVEFITQPANLVNFQDERNVYYWYYATQVTHHMGGEPWKRWNNVMRQALPENQVKQGRQAGSWDPNKPSPDQWGMHGGRLFVTCLSIYNLEVYYRHLPLYAPVFKFIPSTKPAAEK